MLVLRSLMFVPGNQERRIAKALSVDADAIILDLEDSVPPGEKESARRMVAASIDRLASNDIEVFVRINPLQGPYGGPDIRAVVKKGLRGICLPKSDTADDIHIADTLITEAERKANLDTGSTGLLVFIETPKSVINAYQIASASSRILGVPFGAEDYTLEMDITRTKEGTEVYYPRMVVATACHAANVLAIDCVFMDIRDTEGLIKETEMAARMGFQGKLLVHPDQIRPVNQVFTPPQEEIDYAKRVLEAFEAAVSRGEAATSLDGQVVDVPVADRARKLLARAEAIARKDRTN